MPRLSSLAAAAAALAASTASAATHIRITQFSSQDCSGDPTGRITVPAGVCLATAPPVASDLFFHCDTPRGNNCHATEYATAGGKCAEGLAVSKDDGPASSRTTFHFEVDPKACLITLPAGLAQATKHSEDMEDKSYVQYNSQRLSFVEGASVGMTPPLTRTYYGKACTGVEGILVEQSVCTSMPKKGVSQKTVCEIVEKDGFDTLMQQKIW